MQLVIHAGVHRTGTTSLQHFLAGHRRVLAAKGVAYSGPEMQQQKLAWALKRGAAGPDDVLALVGAAADMDRVLLSGEDFSIHQDLAWLAEVARQVDTRAIFYLRRQDHWLNSWYNQHVKWPFDRAKSTMSPADFLLEIEDFYWIDFAATLERWVAVLGRERVEVAVVEPGQVEDVTRDFVHRLGLDARGFEFDERRINDSLPVEALELARGLDLAALGPGKRTRLLEALRRSVRNRSGGAGTVFSPDERNAILERFAESNARTARMFFDRDRLFLERVPDAQDAYFRFPEMSRQVFMMDWVAPLVRELLDGRAERK